LRVDLLFLIYGWIVPLAAHFNLIPVYVGIRGILLEDPTILISLPLQYKIYIWQQLNMKS
jgi:hypothetical protein